MAIDEQGYYWSLTSTGASTAICSGLNSAQNITLTADCESAADTGYFGIEAAADSTSRFVRMGSSAYSISSGEACVVQLDGPLGCIRPYLISRSGATSIIRIRLLGN
jgi:hypothetical protein